MRALTPLQSQCYESLLSQLIEQRPRGALGNELRMNSVVYLRLVLASGLTYRNELDDGVVRWAARARELERIRDFARGFARDGCSIRCGQRIAHEWLENSLFLGGIMVFEHDGV